MTTRTVVTGKNQITIPASLARELGIGAGTQIEWELAEEGYLILRPLPTRSELAKQLQGMLQPLLRPGEDPVAELIQEREREDAGEGL